MQLDQSMWVRISSLLDDALDLPADEQREWLARLAAGQPDTAKVLSELLERHARIETSDFLAALPPVDPARVPAPEFPGWPGMHAPGSRVGPYVLEALVGQGGMGAVWRARRADGALNRIVALKLPAMASGRPDFRDRAARERDILATLEHPRIARLYDAGVSSDGHPYLAMEYVEGQSLPEYCAANRLSLRGRLNLFLQVLDAVQYAHSHLILHRDLKPSNILVRPTGEACLLDFGIAKLMDTSDSGPLEVTQFPDRLLTPVYASPEQLTGESLTVGSDIYSLGVLLYELLTGQRPYRLPRQSMAAVEAAVLESDAERPSQADIRPEVAEQVGGLGVVRLRRELAGDLDTIILHALRKTASQRYPTAGAFAEDLQRYLGGEPVLARPDSALYRIGKFIRRHRYAASSILVGLLSLLLATALSLRAAHVARVQETIARQEATRAEAVQDFLLDIFRTNTHLQADPLKARQTTARELLDLGAAKVSDRLRNTPEAAAEVMMTLGDMYTQMGLNEQAGQLRLQRVEALRRSRGVTREDIADALLDYFDELVGTSRRTLVPGILREISDLIDESDNPDRQNALVRANLWSDVGIYALSSMPEESVVLQDRAVRALRRLNITDPADFSLVLAMEHAARARLELGDCAAAALGFRQTLAEVHARVPGRSAWEISLLAGTGNSEACLGRIPDAEAHLRESLALTVALNGDAHLQTQLARAQLGDFLQASSRRTEGLQLLGIAVAALESSPEAQDSTTAVDVRARYGRALLDAGDLVKSEPLLAQAVAARRSLFPHSSLLAESLLAQGRWFMASGDFGRAQETLDEAFDMRRSIGGRRASPSLQVPYLVAQAELALARNRPADAIEWGKRLDGITAPGEAVVIPRRVVAQTLLAEAHLARGEVAEATALARSAVDAMGEYPLRDYYRDVYARANRVLDRAMRTAPHTGTRTQATSALNAR